MTKKPRSYGSKQIREHAAVASKSARDFEVETNEDFFEEVYGIDEADERVVALPGPVKEPLEREPAGKTIFSSCTP